MVKLNLLLVLSLGLAACSHNNIVQKKSVVAKAKPVVTKIAGKFIDHHNGIITDTSTGLMWKKCSEGQAGDNCKTGNAKKYGWDEVNTKFKRVYFAGYNDWRLPTIFELATLVHCSTGISSEIAGNYHCDGKNIQYHQNPYQRPTINLTAFPNTTDWKYWTSSKASASSASHGYKGLAIYFFNGGKIVNKDLSHVRLVRKK